MKRRGRRRANAEGEGGGGRSLEGGCMVGRLIDWLGLGLVVGSGVSRWKEESEWWVRAG